MESYDVQVRGAGIVGLALSLALARIGLRVALLPDAGAPHGPDVRAYALNAGSVALLKGLKVWDALPANAATPVYDMLVSGDRPPGRIEFTAWQQRVAELAWIVDAAVLERELGSAVRFAPHVRLVEAAQPAALTALCEGRASATREALGIAVDRLDYGQRAVAARLVADRPHQGVARQWFRAPDVLALLPLDTPEPGRSYALVWSLPDADAQAMLAADPAAFEQALAQASGGEAGALVLASQRASWPLALATAQRWCGPGWVLLGDAAHVVHPLAGQGLNLGLADVAALAQVIAGREPWRSLDDERLLRRYVRRRVAPTWAMGRVTDGLLRLFSHDAAPVRELRNRGLTLVNRIAPVKRWLTARALDS
jgi:2-polyprenyl-6-methoxyphenol hydroxylase-like FAD-dependent oxidoreductase